MTNHDSPNVDRALRGEISPDDLDGYERAAYDAEHEILMRRPNPDEIVFFRQLKRRCQQLGVAMHGIGSDKN